MVGCLETPLHEWKSGVFYVFWGKGTDFKSVPTLVTFYFT